MRKYTVDLKVEVCIEDIPLTIDGDGDFLEELTEAAENAVREHLHMLDIKGGRYGSGGVIASIDTPSIYNWNSE